MSASFPRRALIGFTVGATLLVPALPAAATEPAPGDQVRIPASGNGDGRLVFDVTSDVQGDLADWATVLGNYASFEPADALIVNGDIVGGGTQAEYDDFFAVLDAATHAPTLLFSIGNHEFYGGDGTDAAIGRYADNTGMPGVFWRTDVDGVPVLSIGSTQEPGEWAIGNQVVLGEQQLAWLDAQLDGISDDQPVLLFGHHPLPNATSGTIGEGRQDYYDLDYREIDELLAILGDHPNVTFFSGHTHYSLHREDGTNRVVVPDGDPAGFLSVNTGAVQTEWGPEPGGPNQGEWAGPTEFKENLRAVVDGSEVTITYLDHATETVIRELRYDVTDPASAVVTTDVAWPVADDAANPAGSGEIPVTAVIPGEDAAGDSPGDGALALSVADGGLALTGARNAGDRLRLGGVLPDVAVTDTRAVGAWSVTGQSTDLAADDAEGGASVRAENLGWEPFVVAGGARPGAAVLPALAGGVGLGAPTQLGAGVADAATAVLSADVALEVPVDTRAGEYAGAVTVSLFPED